MSGSFSYLQIFSCSWASSYLQVLLATSHPLGSVATTLLHGIELPMPRSNVFFSLYCLYGIICWTQKEHLNLTFVV